MRPEIYLAPLLACFEGLPAASPTGDCLRMAGEQVRGRFLGLDLGSVFQPLFSARDLQPLAHEALLRVNDETGRPLAPPDAFGRPERAEDLLFFDRLCRVIHAVNFVRQGEPGSLFLNVHGRHLMTASDHGRTFEVLLQRCGLTPERIVLEVLEAGIDDLGRLQEAVDAYRLRGYRVAIDDFGCQHSNFDRLWRLNPDIVKLDRSLIVQAETNSRARRILPRLVEIIHELGAQVVCEGIENQVQHELARDAGADLLQGFLYGRPDPELWQSGRRIARRWNLSGLIHSFSSSFSGAGP